MVRVNDKIFEEIGAASYKHVEEYFLREFARKIKKTEGDEILKKEAVRGACFKLFLSTFGEEDRKKIVEAVEGALEKPKPKIYF